MSKQPRVRRATRARASAARRRAPAMRDGSLASNVFFAQAPIGFVTLSDEGLILDVNKAAATLLGVPCEQLRGRPLAQFIAPDERARFAQEWRAGACARACELQMIRHGGGTFWARLEAFTPDDPRAPRVCCCLRDISDRKRTEEDCRFYKLLLDETGAIAKVGGWRFDAQTGAGFWTAETARIHDLDPARPISRDEGIQYYSAASRPLIAAVVKAALEQALPYDLELELITAKGVHKWVHTIGHPISEGGRVVRVVGSLQDITERKEADAQARLQGTRLRMALEAVGLVTWECDLATRTLTYSPNVGALVGHEAAASFTALDRLVEQLHPDDRTRVEQAIAQTIQGGEPFDCEYRIHMPDGSWRWLASRGRPLHMADGGVRRVMGVSQDVTAHRQAIAERERLSTAIEQAAEAIVITDLQATIQYVNPAFTRITGYTHDEAIGQNPRILQSGVHDAAFYRLLWDTITAGRTWQGRFVNRRKDGSTYTEDATISPVRDATGALVNYVAVKRDITHETELETQLQQAQKMESIGRLAGGVAHDFNNLLMGIMGHAELCRDELGPAHPACAHLDEIMSTAQRSAGIARQLLAFASRQAIAPVYLDVNDHVADTLRMLRRLIGENIELAWLPGASNACVKMDPSQIDQILANLAVNARDAISGVGRLTVETDNVVFGAEDCAQYPDAAPGTYVMLAVGDTGCGMSSETMTRIFEPFFTTKPAGEGTGLGLATVYGIVKQNGGFINVYSEPGNGSIFRIYLRHAEGSPGAPSAAAASPAYVGGNETLLLVEDEKDVRVTTALFLDMLGYTVITAANPEEALRQATEHRGAIHVLVTDVIMPGMSGRDLAANMRALYPGIRFLFISGYTSDVIASQGILDDGVQFLAKPFTREQIARKLRAVLVNENTS